MLVYCDWIHAPQGAEAEMGSSNLEGQVLEMFEVGPCETAHQMGLLIGRRFSNLIRSRLARDLILQNQLLPFAKNPESQALLQALYYNNQNKYPKYWEELLGIAEGSGVPVLDVGPAIRKGCTLSCSSSNCVDDILFVHLQIILINFRKEILPFLPKTELSVPVEDPSDDCSDVLVVDMSMAIAAHNEDANVALVGHTYVWH